MSHSSGVSMMICRLCQHEEVNVLIDFGQKPIVHNLLASTSNTYSKYPFRLGHCTNCGFLQILDPIDPQVLYRNYFTISSWKNQPHVERLISVIESITQLDQDCQILDIGCNDGSFLESLREKGYLKVMGIEPTQDASKKALSKSLEVHQGFFGLETASKIYKEAYFDIVITRQVLEHIIDLDDFLIGVNFLLKDEGVFVIEVPDSMWNLDYLDYALWEEHVNYFTFNTLKHLLNKHSLQIIHHETTLFSGKALMVFCEKIKKTNSSKTIFCDHDNAKIRKYRNSFGLYRQELLSFISKVEKPCIVYGCGARSANFVNFMGIGDFIHGFIDDQPEKQNMFVPGYNLKVNAWHSSDYDNYTFLLGVNTENEHKVIQKRAMFSGSYYSILPPSRYLPEFWKSMIYA